MVVRAKLPVPFSPSWSREANTRNHNHCAPPLLTSLPELDFYNATALTATVLVDFRALQQRKI
jgi:hypothetical protein